MEKILIVEDDNIVRENLVELLKLEGYETYSANDGLQALKLLKKLQSIDLIISDIMMPNVDGYELYYILQQKEMGFHIPFIFLTAKTNKEAIRTGMNLGVDDYIVKPFSIDDILNSVKTRIEKKKFFDKILNNLRNDIALYVPHELRTPLVAILGYTDLLLDDFDSISKEEIKETLISIKQAGKRLYNRIEKFMDYSELVVEDSLSGKENYQNNYTVINKEDLNNWIKENIDCSDRLKNIKINVEVKKVIIKKEHFKKILFELVSNACKFSPPNSTIIISGQIYNNTYKLSISDEGRGMNELEINSIGPFKQFNRNYFQQQGNGLGLFIVQRIIKQYKYNMEIESKIDKGTNIKINIPVYHEFSFN